eukprot:Pgem_evm1s2202
MNFKIMTESVLDKEAWRETNTDFLIFTIDKVKIQQADSSSYHRETRKRAEGVKGHDISLLSNS